MLRLQLIRTGTVSAEDYSLKLCWTSSLATIVLYEHMTSLFIYLFILYVEPLFSPALLTTSW